MGTSTLPRMYCSVFCNAINYLINQIIGSKYILKNIAPAGYFRSRLNMLGSKHFIEELNMSNYIAKRRFGSLEKVVLIMNQDDKIVYPASSAWFEYYDHYGVSVTPLRKSAFYVDDYIGLRKLDEEGKVDFVKLPGRHLYVENKHIVRYIVPALI